MEYIRKKEASMHSKRKYVLGFIGMGHMNTAIARGAAVSESIERYQVCVYDHHPERTKALCNEESFTWLESEKEVAENSHIVVLGVTPQKVDAALENLKGVKIECLLTIVTGVPISHYQEVLGSDVPVIRAMPNTPLQIAEGATALCMSANASADDYDFVYSLFSSMGIARTIPEDKMSEIIAVNGSTPAYFYYFIDVMMKDAMAHGIEEESARALLVQTMIGSGELLMKNKTTPIEDFVNEVCSPGGTTIEAVNVMKQDDALAKVLKEANAKCIKRAEELGGK